MAPEQMGKLGRFLKQSFVLRSFYAGGAIYNGSSIRHTSWQTLLTILAAAIIPFVRAKCISENVWPVSRYL
jgi:hypothetical protein